MLNTKQVREIMRKHGRSELWTNQVVSDDNLRRVKCYVPSDERKKAALLAELQVAAGHATIRITSGNQRFCIRPGITVLCTM